MRTRIRLAIAAAACFGLVCGAQAATKLQFIVPSAATGDANRLFLGLVRDFQQHSPEITIELVSLSNYGDVVGRVLSDAAAKRSSGLFVAELSTTLELQAAGAIQPMDLALGDQFGDFKSRLLPSFLGNSGDDVRFLSAPYFRSMPVAFYNLDAMAGAGLAKDALPTSWTEFESVLEKLKSATNRPPLALGGEWYDWLFEAIAATTGRGLTSDGKGIVLNSPGAVEALTILKRWQDKGLMVRSPGWKGTINAFSIGAFPVVFYSSGGIVLVEKSARFSWGTAAIPRHSAHSVPVGGGNLFLSAFMTDDEKAAAIRFMTYLYSPVAQASLSNSTGYFPVTRAAFQEPSMVTRYGGGGTYGRIYSNLPNATAKLMTLNHLKIRAIVKAAIDRTLDDGVPASLSLDRAQGEAMALLKR